MHCSNVSFLAIVSVELCIHISYTIKEKKKNIERSLIKINLK